MSEKSAGSGSLQSELVDGAIRRICSNLPAEVMRVTKLQRDQGFHITTLQAQLAHLQEQKKKALSKSAEMREEMERIRRQTYLLEEDCCRKNRRCIQLKVEMLALVRDGESKRRLVATKTCQLQALKKKLDQYSVQCLCGHVSGSWTSTVYSASVVMFQEVVPVQCTVPLWSCFRKLDQYSVQCLCGHVSGSWTSTVYSASVVLFQEVGPVQCTVPLWSCFRKLDQYSVQCLCGPVSGSWTSTVYSASVVLFQEVGPVQCTVPLWSCFRKLDQYRERLQEYSASVATTTTPNSTVQADIETVENRLDTLREKRDFLRQNPEEAERVRGGSAEREVKVKVTQLNTETDRLQAEVKDVREQTDRLVQYLILKSDEGQADCLHLQGI
ncbi:hypothetical protein ACOMHN_012269 [Nucella lapillus]